MSGVSELDVSAAVVVGTVDVALQPAPSVAKRTNDAASIFPRVIEEINKETRRTVPHEPHSATETGYSATTTLAASASSSATLCCSFWSAYTEVNNTADNEKTSTNMSAVSSTLPTGSALHAWQTWDCDDALCAALIGVTLAVDLRGARRVTADFGVVTIIFPSKNNFVLRELFPV